MIDETHDPKLESWVAAANTPDCDFPIQNLPFATFRKRGREDSHPGVAIGDQILDLSQLLHISALVEIMEWPRTRRRELRREISRLLARYSPETAHGLIPFEDAELLLPCAIGDYADFYASIHHATNVGALFRPQNPLLPNYKWIPIGYHGRASSIIVSGTPIHRPWGQIAPAPAGPPQFAATGKLDFELEVAAFLGPSSTMGNPVPISNAEDHLFGVCLLNDWSARDIQSWEYQPLGPFLGKSFATTISPWIVSLEALEPFRRHPQPRSAGDPEPLPYLRPDHAAAFSIQLEAWLRPAGSEKAYRITATDFRSLYWTFAQMIAHQSSNGCPIRAGDLIGSGTVSGPEERNRGCLLELTRGGTQPLSLAPGYSRSFLEDFDELTLTGWCEAPPFRRIGLGVCSGKILPQTR